MIEKKKKKPTLTLVTPHPLPQETDIKPLIKSQEEFNKAYEVPKNNETKNLYVKLIDEEHEEWVEEFYRMVDRHFFEELKELTDLLYVTCGLYYQMGYTPDKTATYRLSKDETYDFVITKIVERIITGARDKKTLLQLMYCIYAYADEMGWNINEAYKRVHHSNMSKLGNDGKPVRREDGKVMKGPNYKPPFLEDLTNGE